MDALVYGTLVWKQLSVACIKQRKRTGVIGSRGNGVRTGCPRVTL